MHIHDIIMIMPVKNKTKKFFFSFLALWLLIASFSCDQGARVENLGIFGLSRKRSVLGQDGCTPVPLGKIMMWTFGDTILGTWKGELSVSSTFEDSAVMNGMISNSLAFTEIPDDDTIKNLQFRFYKNNGRVAQFIKYSPGEDPRIWRLWPADGIRLGSTVYVYYYMVLIEKSTNRKSGELPPMRIMGTGIAEWKIPPSWKTGDPVDFRRTVKIFSGDEPIFGDCVEKQGDYLYIIGRGSPHNGRAPAFIARVRISEIKNRRAYNFLDMKNRWSSEIGSARPFFNDVAGEILLSYNEYLKKYVIIYCSLKGAIKYAAFNNFAFLKSEEAKDLYAPPPLPRIESRPHLFYYSGKEIRRTQKGIYAIYINPAIYQPILLKVPYTAVTESAKF